MLQKESLGNSIQPLSNVAALTMLITRIKSRQFGLPGMGVFYGPTGFGKTFASIHAAVTLDAIHVSIQRMWTKKTLLTQILRELQIMPQKTMAEMMMQVNEGLALANRPLIIDEADYAVARGMIEIIRDMHDGSHIPVILVGEELMPQKLRKWERVDGRVHSWVAAQPADLKDAKLLARIYARGITIDDGLIERIVDENRGSARRICTDLAYVLEQARQAGLDEMTSERWGKQPFLRGTAPAPREGL